MSYLTEKYKMKADFKPWGNYILIDIQLPPEEKQTESGIAVIQDNEKKAPQVALVVAVGDGLTDLSGNKIPNRAVPGQYVLIMKHAPFDIRDMLGDRFEIPETFRMIAEGDILGEVIDTGHAMEDLETERQDIENKLADLKKKELEERSKIDTTTNVKSRIKKIIYRGDERVEEG